MSTSFNHGRRRGASSIFLVCIAALILNSGCVGPRPGTKLERRGDEIVVCGQLFHTGAPVVLWTDPQGYDAYRVECRFDPDAKLATGRGANQSPNRYGTFRRHLSDEDAAQVRAEGWTLPMLRKYVDLFVLHFDVCGTSRRCFKVLQDQRGLSVHFMLDVDGTIYQALDVKERAWHAGVANDRSVGVEIANMGAYEDPKELEQWYSRDADGRVVFHPIPTDGATGIRTAGFVPRPARKDIVTGRINGRDLNQYDFTDAQYASLIRLAATLRRVLPKIQPVAPRDANGEIQNEILTDEQFAKFSGIVGHWHLSKNKFDPGPAMNWDRVLRGVRRFE